MDTIEEKVRAAISKFKGARHQHPPPPDKTAVYKLSFDIDPPGEFRTERFADTEDDGILHRPQIVEDMKNMLFDDSTKTRRRGLFIKGPQGIGKSHSLVDLVDTLRAEGHLVTFIPDCEKWDGDYEFVRAIFRSIGTTMRDLGINGDSFKGTFIMEFLDCLVGVLRDFDVHWVLVFDQLNRIFGRGPFLSLKDVGVLPIPFRFMKTLNKHDHVTTVIAASANNGLSYKEHHEGFVEYNHPLQMTEDEVKIWKPISAKFDDKQFNSLLEDTGRCPLQISERLKKSSREEYEREAVAAVVESTRELLGESSRDEKTEIVDHAVCCLLCIPKPNLLSNIYDKKYSVLSDGLVKPVFPVVLVAYREIFWDDLMAYVAKNEAELMQVCSNPHVSNDVRGRLFELMVISRFRKERIVSRQPAMDVLPAQVDAGMVFESQDLPTPQQMDANALFIPKNSNFPAIDLILKDEKDVWAIQVHVADHENVEPTLRRMCEKRRWFEFFDNIFLVYLGPLDEIRRALTCIPLQASRVKRPRLAKQAMGTIQVSAMTKDQIECLKSIQWPSTSRIDESSDEMQLSG